MYFVREGMSKDFSHTISACESLSNLSPKYISLSHCNLLWPWTKRTPGSTNIRNHSKNQVFPQKPFFKINCKLKMKNLWTKNWDVSTDKLSHSKLLPLCAHGKTVDVYDDLCNVLKAVQ